MWVVPSSCSSVGKQSQLLLKPTEVELGLQDGVEFDNFILDSLVAEKTLSWLFLTHPVYQKINSSDRVPLTYPNIKPDTTSASACLLLRCILSGWLFGEGYD